MLSELHLWHEQFCQHCLVMKGQSRYTLAGYRDMIRSFVKFTGASTLADISLAKVERWIALGTARHQWSPVTSRGRLKYMIVFVKWLVERGQLAENPLEGISLPRLPKKLPKRLSRDQAEELLRYVRNEPFRTKFEGARAYAVIALLIYTGIRRRELQDLELSDVDLDRGIVSVRQGKGARDRLIACPPQLSLVLREYLQHRSHPRFAHLPYFFVGHKARGKLGIKVLSRLVTRLREGSGIYFAPHMLRHTYATLMLEGGCDLFSLSKLMGHADIKTTTIYLSATVRHLQQQALKHPVLL